jgi:SUKH-4 immunity protein
MAAQEGQQDDLGPSQSGRLAGVLTDDTIEAALGKLRPIRRQDMPVEGEWKRPPFPDRVVKGRATAVICEDPGLSAIVVDRDDGHVLQLDPDERPWMMNSSVAQLVACARAYQRAQRAAFLAESGESDESDESDEKIEERLRAEIAAIDAPSIENENWIWPAIVQEFSFGM